MVKSKPPNGPNKSLKVCQNHLNTTPISAARSAIVIKSIVENLSKRLDFLENSIALINNKILIIKVP